MKIKLIILIIVLTCYVSGEILVDFDSVDLLLKVELNIKDIVGSYIGEIDGTHIYKQELEIDADNSFKYNHNEQSAGILGIYKIEGNYRLEKDTLYLNFKKGTFIQQTISSNKIIHNISLFSNSGEFLYLKRRTFWNDGKLTIRKCKDYTVLIPSMIYINDDFSFITDSYIYYEDKKLKATSPLMVRNFSSNNHETEILQDEYNVGSKPLQKPIKVHFDDIPLFAYDGPEEVICILNVEVFNDGSIGEIKVSQSIMSGPGGLDEVAINSIKKWKFSPAINNDISISNWNIIQIKFNMIKRTISFVDELIEE